MIECLYDAFMSAAGNTDNYIDYLVLKDFSYKTEGKTFDDIYHDQLLQQSEGFRGNR